MWCDWKVFSLPLPSPLSLRRQVDAINKLAGVGMFFWDYGNAFLKEASNAGENSSHFLCVHV